MSAVATVVEVPRFGIRADLWLPLSVTSARYRAAVAVCSLLVLAGLCAWGYQISRGLGVAGYSRPVFWAFYEANFVFWIGISHAGTLISAILRLTHAGWRKPVTRAAEAITVFALMIGAMLPLVHLGRVWLFYWLIPYPNGRLLWPNFRSPLMWDLTAIFTYLSASVLYLYVPMIPDFAQLAACSSGWRHRVYRVLALRWTGSHHQWRALEQAMKLMAAVVLAIAVSVHTIVAWDFAMAIVPMWHSTIFGPYFVVGAIFSGIAALAVVMAALRRFLHLERYLEPLHFDYLGKLLLLMSLTWVYFTLAEHLTVWYGNQPAEYAVFQERIYGRAAPLFWTMATLNFAIPFFLLGIRRLRTPQTVTLCGLTVLAGMWIERYLIVVNSLTRPRLASVWAAYAPTWVELTITVTAFAAMILLYLIFVKFVPVIAVWEYEDAAHR